jgi:CBS domain-containing protein
MSATVEATRATAKESMDVRVAEVMTEASVSESPSDTLRAAAVLMWREQTGSLVVLAGDALVGIITERDILRATAQDVDIDALTVGEVMTEQVVTTSADVSLHDAARVMAQHWIRHLPVVDDDRVVGMLSQRDIMGVFAALRREPGAIEIDSDELVRARRLVRISHGDLD